MSGVEPEQHAPYGYWFEGEDDWAVRDTWGRTYEPVGVLWEGGYIDVTG